jgi:hypothetical protein
MAILSSPPWTTLSVPTIAGSIMYTQPAGITDLKIGEFSSVTSVRIDNPPTELHLTAWQDSLIAER